MNQPPNPAQFPPIGDEFAQQRALPPGVNGGPAHQEPPIPVTPGPAPGYDFEARLRDVEKRLRASPTPMTRQAFELQAILGYLQHAAAFPTPQLNLGDVMLTAQMLTDVLQRRGFFENTPEYRPVPLRVQKQGVGGQQGQGPYPQQQNYQQPQGANNLYGDHPQGGDHRVQVSYPAMGQ